MLKDMQFRVKELTCLYSIIQLFEKSNNLPNFIKGACVILPVGCRYHELIQAQIAFEGKVYATKDFHATPSIAGNRLFRK